MKTLQKYGAQVAGHLPGSCDRCVASQGDVLRLAADGCGCWRKGPVTCKPLLRTKEGLCRGKAGPSSWAVFGDTPKKEGIRAIADAFPVRHRPHFLLSPSVLRALTGWSPYQLAQILTFAEALVCDC